MTRCQRLARPCASLLLALTVAAPGAGAQTPTPPGDYLAGARSFADALLTHGPDRYGPRALPMWAGLIDTRDHSVPPITEAKSTQGGDGYYDSATRRAVGGANLYHDLETLHAFDLLSALTGDGRYARAARDYTASYLSAAQNEDTGLLGWGEHLFYDFYEDRVTAGGNHSLAHEFLARTPAWDRMWSVDPQRTARAIQGLRFHFRSPQTQTFLFNRHALWVRDTADSPYGLMAQYQYNYGQPWIKHSGLLAYSLTFLHARTGDPDALRLALGVGNLYWNYRNPETGLTLSCIDDPRPTSARAGLEGTGHLAYWLFRASELHPGAGELRSRALALFDAIERYAWAAGDGYYYTGPLNLDGTRFGEQTGPQFLADFGRTAAYLARRTGEARYLKAARRMAAAMERDTLPTQFYADQVAGRIHLLMDLHDLTGEPQLLARARSYADRGVAGLWRGGLFARRVGDPYYESKDGVGSFVGGLLRLHLAGGGAPPGLAAVDWSY